MTTSNNELESYKNRLQELVNKLTEKSNLPGIALDLSANGWRIQVAAGRLAADSPLPMDANSRFEIGTVSHLLFSLSMANLATQGKVDLEAPIGTLLPELADSQVGERVQIWHLLSNTGGYKSISLSDAEVRFNYDWEKLVAYMRTTPILFEPGTVFSYTATAPALVAEIIHRVTGTPALTYIRSCFLDPLCENVGTYDGDAALPEINVVSHGADPSSKSFIRAARFKVGDFWMSSLSDFTLSLRDLNRLVEAIMEARDRTQPTEASPIHPKSAQILQKQIIDIPYCALGAKSERLPKSVGIGSAEFLPEWIGFNGPFAGQSMCVRYHAKQNISLAVGINAHVPHLREALIHEVIASLTGGRPSTARPPALKFDARELVGTYSGAAGGQDVEITTLDKDIVCKVPVRQGVPPLKVLFRQDDEGNWVLRSDPGIWSIGFFRDHSDTPCMMLGAIAHRKVA